MTERINPFESQKTIETRPHLATQAVVVRTAGSPELLQRSLSAIRRDTPTDSLISIGVVDDSNDSLVAQSNLQVIADTGIDISYLSTKKTGPGTILNRIHSRALQLARENGISEATMNMAYKYLLTNQQELDSPTFLPELQVGSGSKATTNVATILGAYMLGATRTSEGSGVITHYDHDVIPGETLLTGPNEVPIYSRFNPPEERERLFADPDILLTTGKYAGIAGDPFGTGMIALQVTESILSDFFDPVKSKDEISKYKLYDAANDTFREVTIGQSYDALPEIIQSFLHRAPMAGFLTADGPELTAFTPANIKFDGGDFTLKDTVSRRLPAPPTGAHEYGILSVLKAFAGDQPEKVIGIEQPVLHIRKVVPADADPHGGGLLSGTSGWGVRNQVLIELALASYPQLAATIYTTITGLPAPDNLLGNLPKLNTQDNLNKRDRIDQLKRLRGSIQEIKDQSIPGDTSVAASINKLLEAFDDKTIKAMQDALNPASYDKDQIRKMSAAIRRFYIPSLKAWPLLYDAAYQVGLEVHNLLDL